MAAPAPSRVANPFDQFDVVPAQPARAGNPWDNDPIVVAAPAPGREADPWAAFDGTPPGQQQAAAAPQSFVFQSVPPRQLQSNEPGYAAGRMTNLSPQDWARFHEGVQPAAPAPPGQNPFDRFDPPASPSSTATQNPVVGRPWEQFAPGAASATPPAASAPPAGPWTQFAPQNGEHGYAPAPAAPAHDPWAAFDGDPAHSKPGQPNPFDRFDPPQPQQAQRTGLAANAVAGAEEGAAGLVNTATDPFSYLVGKPLVTAGMGAYNLGARLFGYDKLSPEFQHAMLEDDVPTPGGAVVDAAARAVGAPTPGEVAPGNAMERYVRAGTAGAVGMAALGPAGTTGQALRTGAASGVGSQVASDIAPDDLKPAAGLVGGVVGPVVPSVVAAPLRAAVGAPLNALAGYAGPAIGRTNPLLDVGGAQFTTDLGQPLAASRNQVNLAATRARGLMSDPAAVQNALNAAPAPVTTPDGRAAGPTTGQLTRDPNLIAAEQQAAAGPAGPAFQARAAAQNDARVAAIRGVADGADPAALPSALQRQAADSGATRGVQVQNTARQSAADLAQAQQLLDQHRANLDQRAQQAAQAIGGNYAAGSDAQVGAVVRAPLDAAQRAARTQESALWQGIDPNGTLAVDMTPVRDRANAIASGIGPNAAKPSGDEAAVLGIAQRLPDVQSFRDLQDLRQQLTDGIRTARSNPKANSQTVPRLQGLLDSVHDAMARSVNDSELPAGSGQPAEQAATGVPGAPNAPGAAGGAVVGDGATNQAPSTGSAVFTPSGRRIDVRYGVREAGDLTASQLPDGRTNPAYPAELQPRDRTRAASQQQVNRIANTLEPERLGASASTAEGAPIVGPDGVVESGNGRTLAIQQAHANGGPQSQAYRDYLAQQGYDVSGMKAPVLVRERTTPLTNAERPGFADDAGSNPILSMSAAERAAADAKRLPGDAMDLWRGGDVTDARNRDFVRAFAQHVLPEGEHAAFMTQDGSLSTEGVNRVRNALTQHAYGSNDLVAGLAENADPNLRAFGGALQDASGPMAKLRSAIDAGNVSSASDLSKPLVEAANLVQNARRTNTPLSELVAQRDAFAQRDPMVEPLLRAAYGDDLSGRISRAKFSDLLSHYADEAQQQGGLFGGNKSRTDMVGEAAQRYGYGTGQTEASAPGTAPGAGAGTGADGNPTRRPGDGAPGQAASGVGSGASASGSSTNAGTRDRSAVAAPPAQQLTANFDRAAASRYAAARQATADRVGTFKGAPGVGPALQSGPSGFRMADSAVPDAIVRTGSAGADVAKAYLKAGGTPEALAAAAAFSLRQTAMKDGVIDPAKYASWAQQRQSFLSQIPDAAARFGAAADAARAAREGGKTADALLKQAAGVAQRTVDDAMAARAAATKAEQASVAGKFLGDADPVRQVGAILRGKTAAADMEHLARVTANDPEARAGLRRAVGDYILRDLKGNAESATSGDSFLKGDQLRTFLRNSGPALEKIMTPADMQGLRSVADSLAQSSVSAAKGRGAGTANLADAGSGSFLKRVTHELFGAALGMGTGASVGSFVAGPIGASVGSVAGAAVGKALQAAREAGLQNVDNLVSQALLNPALMKTLLAKATPANTPSLTANLAAQLRPLALVTAARGPDPQQQRRLPGHQVVMPRRSISAPPPNALTGLAPLRSVPTSSNALLR